MVARPRNERKLLQSVIVVSTIDDDCAGSWPAAFRISGMAAPETPAMTMARIIAEPMTSGSPIEWLQMKRPTIGGAATAAPVTIPVPASLTLRRGPRDR